MITLIQSDFLLIDKLDKSDFLIKRKVDMPAKKTKKTPSQASTKKSVGKKVTTKKTVSTVNASKAPAKKPLKAKLLSSNAATKKIAVNKTEQVVNQEKPVKKEQLAKKSIWPIIILLVALALWFLRSQIIVAMVNGKPITRFKLISELEKQGASQILDSLVTMELVNQAINEADIKVDDQEIADQMAEIEATLASQNQNLDDILAMQNLTREDIEKDIKLNLQVDKILADKIQVTDEEVMEYFETNKEILGEDANFEEMKKDIEAQVIQEKRSAAQQEWLETLRSEANIRYLKFEPSLL
ncbi:SurA N-terminal domain-containing protein [Candidatus Woesebacteria bacterium]|jgi:hypothetical protein|nr:SurA N-terminal domain-containing protein [Candidatus Woesebacteria bacterium]HOP38985.1 SurA N-terminal domain-containing protein [Candidatus Woesebacteria bacterium]HPK08319.1 SurA N-terminal domain-containing protein [Candidatus Woesebacteria bacterium]HQO51314.1 SurA N-terminal domain-containing protein [Candidatus Woesebacteria bacterium]